MPIISAKDMMNLYLYGKDQNPNLDSEEPIREEIPPLGSVTHKQDLASYMIEGAGRFALGAASSLVQKFFEAPDKSLFATIKSSPHAIQIDANTVEIDKDSLNKLINFSAYMGIKQSQYELDDSSLPGGRADYFDRTFVWGSTAFKLGDVRFRVERILDASGNFVGERRTIENYSVAPDLQERAFGADDFDFTSRDGVTGQFNAIFEPVFDPSKIGRTVYIEFTGVPQIAENPYDSQRYLDEKQRLDSSKVSLLTAMDHLVAGSNYLATELFQNGVARWIDADGRAILYGSNDADDMSASRALTAGPLAGLFASILANDSPLEPYRKANGVAFYAGKGDDKLTGGDKADHLLGGAGNDTIIGGAGDDEIDGGAGHDVVDYRQAPGGVKIENTPNGGYIVHDDGYGDRDTLVSIEEIKLTEYGDTGIIFGSISDFVKGLGAAASGLLKTILDFGGQQSTPTPPSGVSPQTAATPQRREAEGDKIDASGPTGQPASRGMVFNLRYQDAQFVADMQGAVPTRLGYDGATPTSSWGVMKFLANTVLEFARPTNLSGYAAEQRLDLKNVENASGTEQSDLIIGADTVYTWKTPEPTPQTPNPQPERVVDKDFRGYDLTGNGGNDTILVYNGDKDQVTWRLIDGGDGNDVIVAKDFGNQFYLNEQTGELAHSQILGGAGNDVILSIGAGVGGDVIGGTGSDVLMNTAYKGRIWGDSKDGNGEHSSDIFLWSAGSFIMDAEQQDILEFFGLPLTGGYGVQTKGEEWAYDWVLPFIRYGLTDSKQLVVQSWIGNIVDHVLRSSPNDDILKSSMIVEDYDQGEGRDRLIVRGGTMRLAA